MERILIVNAVVVNEGREAEGDVYVRNGRIARVGGDLGRLQADVVLDAAGAHLLPGMIDAHVHFREPGLTHKGDLASESRAAVAGGVTSSMDMPNTLPPTTTLEALEDKYRRAAACSLANYAFYFGATNSNLDAVARLAPGAACGVKVFMGASTGDMLVDAPHSLEEKQRPYLQAPSGIPLIQHALPCLLEHVHDGRLPLTLVVEKTCHAVARRFGVVERGFIREGYWADLTLVDLNRPSRVTRTTLLSKCGWSPFEGREFRSSVVATIVSGRLAYKEGNWDPIPSGQRLGFR